MHRGAARLLSAIPATRRDASLGRLRLSTSLDTCPQYLILSRRRDDPWVSTSSSLLPKRIARQRDEETCCSRRSIAGPHKCCCPPPCDGLQLCGLTLPCASDIPGRWLAVRVRFGISVTFVARLALRWTAHTRIMLTPIRQRDKSCFVSCRPDETLLPTQKTVRISGTTTVGSFLRPPKLSFGSACFDLNLCNPSFDFGLFVKERSRAARLTPLADARVRRHMNTSALYRHAPDSHGEHTRSGRTSSNPPVRTPSPLSQLHTILKRSATWALVKLQALFPSFLSGA